MQDWGQHSDSTGGYFQCNRFVEAALESGAAATDPWVNERGSSHFEAQRLKLRKATMARFIHHYTR
jgi:hypothetical protein